MCGRFVRRVKAVDAAAYFGVEEIESDLSPSYNIAPKQPIAVIVEHGKRKLVTMQWGLIPNWSKDPKIAYKLINARAETVAEKPMFRSAFKSRRCLIVADGFYEWRTEGGRKTPVYIFLRSGRPFGMAGIYETWTPPEGQPITTCSIITTEANELMKSIHDRMPAIIDPRDHDDWLNPENQDIPQLRRMLKPFTAAEMERYDVSANVNSVYHNSPDCIKPAGQTPPAPAADPPDVSR